MRPIKFRAWCPAYRNPGEFSHSSDYSAHMTEPFGLFDVPDDLPDDAVIMQFTGLHDKNGKEIFEGDIVQIPTGYKVEIKPIFFSLGYEGSECYGYHAYKHGEVLGNIYENPELLSATKERD